MNQSNQFHVRTEVDLGDSTSPLSGKELSDRAVLRYMARRTYARLLDLSFDAILPSLHYIEERRNRTHRVVIYNPQELLQGNDLFFVGFVSRVREHIDHSIIQELHRVDKVLVTEVASNPGLFSYSSLEVHRGCWYNLVLLSNDAAKSYFHSLDIHTYAVHQLATHYYLWIRLHNGSMPAGLFSNELVLQSTKYYTFPVPGQKPLLHHVLHSVGAQVIAPVSP